MSASVTDHMSAWLKIVRYSSMFSYGTDVVYGFCLWFRRAMRELSSYIKVDYIPFTVVLPLILRQNDLNSYFNKTKNEVIFIMLK